MRRKGVILDDPISSDSDSASPFKTKRKKSVHSKPKPPQSTPTLIVLSSSDDDSDGDGNTGNGNETETTSLGGKKVVSPFSIANERRKRRRKARNKRKEVACPRCTYLNLASASRCVMCDAPLQSKHNPVSTSSTTSKSPSKLKRTASSLTNTFPIPMVASGSQQTLKARTSKDNGKKRKAVISMAKKVVTPKAAEQKQKTQTKAKAKAKAKAKEKEKERAKENGRKKTVEKEKTKIFGSGSGCGSGSVSWLDLHAPLDEVGLLRALNKKKVLEMKGWLRNTWSNRRVLILHGPSGSGKTTCIKVLAKDLGCSIRQWSSEQQRGATFSRNVSDGDATGRHDLHVPYVSEVKDFEEFLYFSKYPQLNVVSKEQTKHLTLVKELPAAHSPEVKAALHQVFARVVNSRSTNKVAFVYTSPSESTNPREMAELFSEYVLSHPATAVVGLRDVPVLRLKRVLQDIGEKEGLNLGKERYKEIAEGSQGDMRCAIQSLQFKGKENRKTNADAQVNAKRDLMFSMNHSVGKLIRGKRTSDEPDAKLNYDPETVAEASALAPDALTLFLDYHFVEYFSDVEDMYNVYDSLSLTDVWSKSGCVRGVATYQKRDKLFPHAYVVSLGSRSVATYNRHLVKNGFVRITKPRMYSVTSRARERQHLVDTHLASTVLGSSDFVLTEIAPWLSMFPSVERIDLNVLDNISFQTSAITQKKPVKAKPRQEANEDETQAVLEADDIVQ